MPKITDPDLARPQSFAPLLHPHDNVVANPAVVTAVPTSTSFFQDYKIAIIISVVVLIVVMIVFVYVGKRIDKNKSAANTSAKAKLDSTTKALPTTPPGSTPETVNMEEIKRLRDMRISQKAASAAKREKELAQQDTTSGPANSADDEPQESATGKVDNVSTAVASNVSSDGGDDETNNSEADGDAKAMFDALLDENEDLGEYSGEN